MITLNGKRFAESDDEFDSQCVGTAKRSVRQIKIFNTCGALIGVINRFGVLCKATAIEGGGHHWFSYGTIREIGEYESYMKRREDIAALSIQRDWVGNESLYRFK